jgi:hypothetical protein
MIEFSGTMPGTSRMKLSPHSLPSSGDRRDPFAADSGRAKCLPLLKTDGQIEAQQFHLTMRILAAA